MIFATLGKLDLITVLILMGAAIMPQSFLVYAAFYLIIKGAVFIYISRDFASYGDFACGIYLFVLSFGRSVPIVHTLVLLWLLQKTMLTFIAIGIRLSIMYYNYKGQPVNR